MKERPILFSAAMVRAILEGRKTQTRRVVKPQPSSTMTDAVLYLDHTTWCFTGPQRDGAANPLPLGQWKGGWPDCGPDFTCPYGVSGERLWVRETLGVVANWGTVQYAADGAYVYDPEMRKAGFPYADECESMVERWGDDYNVNDFKLIPSIFMPRWASRITLEITDVRVQRLQEISFEDCLAEGIISTEFWDKVKGSEIEELSKVHPKEWTVDQSIDQSWIDYTRLAYRELWDSINGKTHPWASNPWLWCLTFKRVNS